MRLRGNWKLTRKNWKERRWELVTTRSVWVGSLNLDLRWWGMWRRGRHRCELVGGRLGFYWVKKSNDA